MPICRARIGLKHFQKPIEKVRDPRDPRDPRDLRTRALFVYTCCKKYVHLLKILVTLTLNELMALLHSPHSPQQPRAFPNVNNAVSKYA